MISIEDFSDKYNISTRRILASGLSWEQYCHIYEDYQRVYYKKKKAMNDFLTDYLTDWPENSRIHSIRSRVKDPEHLIAKIIIRREENYKKYGSIDENNYLNYITDIIGIRCFILYKEDWSYVHNYLTSRIDTIPERYIKDYSKTITDDENLVYFSEEPKAYIREGDSRKPYEGVLPDDLIEDRKIYRSVHYNIRYKGSFVEIQVRTLFEEGWGEIDHDIVYPKYKNDPIFDEYTRLLNRVSGLADEMGSFFRVVQSMKEKVTEGSVDPEEKPRTEVTASDETDIKNIEPKNMWDLVEKSAKEGD